MRLIPGVAVASKVLANIDKNRDSLISAAEQRNYAERVLRDLSFTLDGTPLTLRLGSVVFPKIADVKEGLGEIHIELNADLPPGRSGRTLVFQNHHAGGISVYLVNSLVPLDRSVKIVSQ
jgi:hypothetical protein